MWWLSVSCSKSHVLVSFLTHNINGIAEHKDSGGNLHNEKTVTAPVAVSFRFISIGTLNRFLLVNVECVFVCVFGCAFNVSMSFFLFSSWLFICWFLCVSISFCVPVHTIGIFGISSRWSVNSYASIQCLTTNGYGCVLFIFLDNSQFILSSELGKFLCAFARRLRLKCL